VSSATGEEAAVDQQHRRADQRRADQRRADHRRADHRRTDHRLDVSDERLREFWRERPL
jgi:hypothetical protein